MTFTFLKHFTLKGSETGTEHGQKKLYKFIIYLQNESRPEENGNITEVIPLHALQNH